MKARTSLVLELRLMTSQADIASARSPARPRLAGQQFAVVRPGPGRV